MMDSIICLGVVGVAVILGLGMFIGVMLCNQQTADERARLAELERELQAAWDALERAQQLHTRFWASRLALRDEALHHRTPGVFDYRPSR